MAGAGEGLGAGAGADFCTGVVEAGAGVGALEAEDGEWKYYLELARDKKLGLEFLGWVFVGQWKQYLSAELKRKSGK